MNDKTDTDPDDTASDPLEATGAEPLTHASTTYKLLGELAAVDGAGVLGHNTATSGVAVGVKGVTDSTEGYGLSTPNDAQVGGTAELAALGGSLTGGTAVTDITGEGLSVDGSGALGWSVTYEKHRFTSAGSTWDAVTGLSSETPVEVALSGVALSGGKIRLDVDGSVVGEVIQGQSLHRIVGATSSVSVATEPYFSHQGTFSGFRDSNPTSGAFGPNGTKLFVVGSGSDAVRSYDLSTAWDVETASFDKGYDISSQSTTPASIELKPDGTRMFVADRTSDAIYTYDMTTAWDLDTAGHSSSFDVSSYSPEPSGLTFSDDGVKAFVTHTGTSSYAAGRLDSYSTDTAWALNVASYDTSRDVSGWDNFPVGVSFDSTGTRLFLLGTGTDSVNLYDLSTAWDITSASHVETLDISSLTTAPSGLAASDDGTNLYVFDGANGVVYQYDEMFSGVGNAWIKME